MPPMTQNVLSHLARRPRLFPLDAKETSQDIPNTSARETFLGSQPHRNTQRSLALTLGPSIAWQETQESSDPRLPPQGSRGSPA